MYPKTVILMRACRILCVKHALQCVNGHADTALVSWTSQKMILNSSLQHLYRYIKANRLNSRKRTCYICYSKSCYAVFRMWIASLVSHKTILSERSFWLVDVRFLVCIVSVFVNSNLTCSTFLFYFSLHSIVTVTFCQSLSTATS
jgi:hypothetical protein